MRIVKLLFACVLAMGISQATTLTGTLKLPNGVGANGRLYLSLGQQGSLQSGGCGGPAEIVPTYQVQIVVTNGALGGSPSVYGADCMLPLNIFYNVVFKDNNGNTLFVDRWLITGSTVDIGTIVSVIINGTTGSLGGGVVLQTPGGDQTVTQPGSTNLNVNRLVVSARSALPGGTVCTVAGCVFSVAAAFNGGITTPSNSNSEIYMGTQGNFFNRTFSGADASCSGIANGWMGIRTDTNEIQFCSGGVTIKFSSGGGGGGGGGFPLYTAPFTSATGVTVTAATHGQGTSPFDGGCFDSASPKNAIVLTANFPTVSSTGTVVYAWTGSKTGYCLIGGSGATGTAGGVLSGLYPNPGLANGVVTIAKIASSAFNAASPTKIASINPSGFADNYCVKYSASTGELVSAGAVCGGGGSTSFSSITAGTNANILTTSNQITFSGPGTINANRINSVLLSTLGAGILKQSGIGVPAIAVSGTDYEAGLSFSAPLLRSVNTISIPASSASADGYLSSTFFNFFSGRAGPGTCSANFYVYQTTTTGVLCAQVAYGQVSGTPTLRYQLVGVAGTSQTARGRINFIAGTNVTITPADSSGTDSTNITISASGGGGSGDVSSNTSSSVVNEVVLFADTTGKLIKRGTLSGVGLFTSGVLSGATSANIYGLWSGTCSATTLLHGAGACGAVSLTADVSGILPGANGGTNNGFYQIAGFATTLKTHTWPNQSIDWTSYTGIVKMTAGVPSVVGGTSTNCVLVDGTSAVCTGGGGISLPMVTTRSSGTVLTVGSDCVTGSTNPCLLRVGSVVYTFTTGATATLTTGAGLAYLYISSAGAITVGVPAGITSIACSGCTVATSVTAFPVDSIPLGTWNATANTWDATGTNYRSILSNGRTFIAGTNVTLTQTGSTVTINSAGTGGCAPAGSSGQFLIDNGSGGCTSISATGTGNGVKATSPALITPDLGVPTFITLTNGTALPISTGVSGLGTNVATFLASPSSANFAAAITGETGTGNVVFSADPVMSGVITIGSAAAPTINAIGQLAVDNDLWASGRGAYVGYDGTAKVAMVATLFSDTPTDGQVPTWHTGGTTTWDTPTGGGGTPCTLTALSLQYNNAGAFGCLAEFTYASATITSSSSGIVNLSAGKFVLPTTNSAGTGISIATVSGTSQISFDPSVLSGVYPTIAGPNTFTAGGKNTFTASATTAGFRLVGTADPSSPVAGDMWISLVGALKWYDGSAVQTAGTATGTVSSVSWTGGIVSIATATTTPAFTIAGTSGGVPYFSSASAWATSAALGANLCMFGGGAGTAPFTDSDCSLSGGDTLVLTALTVNGFGVTNNILQNSQSSAYTTVLSDCGKEIYHPGADTTARVWTIAANSSVAAPIGCAITFTNDTSGGVITISITSDTLVLGGPGTTGSRTLAASGIATAKKVTSTRWIITGAGLT